MDTDTANKVVWLFAHSVYCVVLVLAIIPTIVVAATYQAFHDIWGITQDTLIKG